MVNPQKENGYTPISNELLEVIYSKPFNATQLKILLVICRYTYGFSRKKHSLSKSFIAKAANISKRHISSELIKLIDQNVITVIEQHTEKSSRVLALNKHYDKWGWGTVLHQGNYTSPPQGNCTSPGEGNPASPGVGNCTSPKINKSLKQNLKQREPLEIAIDDFKEFRKKTKSPMTERAVELLHLNLDKLSGDDKTKIAILEQSIMNGWKSVYPLKEQLGKSSNAMEITDEQRAVYAKPYIRRPLDDTPKH
jgi:phage replication O-like protein O